jgi:hypothetical protein
LLDEPESRGSFLRGVAKWVGNGGTIVAARSAKGGTSGGTTTRVCTARACRLVGNALPLRITKLPLRWDVRFPTAAGTAPATGTAPAPGTTLRWLTSFPIRKVPPPALDELPPLLAALSPRQSIGGTTLACTSTAWRFGLTVSAETVGARTLE